MSLFLPWYRLCAQGTFDNKSVLFHCLYSYIFRNVIRILYKPSNAIKKYISLIGVGNSLLPSQKRNCFQWILLSLVISASVYCSYDVQCTLVGRGRPTRGGGGGNVRGMRVVQRKRRHVSWLTLDTQLTATYRTPTPPSSSLPGLLTCAPFSTYLYLISSHSRTSPINKIEHCLRP